MSHQVTLSVGSLFQDSVDLSDDMFVNSPRSERREEIEDKTPGSPVRAKPPQTQRELFDFVLDEGLSVTRCESKPLSLTKRAMIEVVHDEDSPPSRRYIVRVSVHSKKECPIWTAEGASQRILAFGTYWMENQGAIKGLVPILSTPSSIDTPAGSIMVERYAEVVYNPVTGKRMDLLGLCSAESANLSRPLRYVYDVAVTLAGLHRHGWCHMDVSLENVALSPTQAYLIDFESCLPFSKSGYVRRASIKVPLKLPFVPPEHFTAKRSHYISLRAYDVWGWGLLVFEAIFQCYLFDLVSPSGDGNSNGGRTYSPNMAQVEYFCDHGFRAFVQRHHPPIYRELYSTAKGWIAQARDLFEKVFTVPTPHTSRHSGVVRWVDDNRLSCAEAIRHPFWRSVGCAPAQ